MSDIYEVTFESEPSYSVDFTELQSFIVKVGRDGVGIEKMELTASEGLIDTYTVTLTDGKTVQFTVTNARTPVRGSDYWTSADIAEIKSYVDDAILGGQW